MKLSLTAIFFTFFIDTLSWAIVFPIFAPFFLDPDRFSPDWSLGVRTAVLGFFLMAFSLGQFFGAPFIGEYGDKHGRRKALLVSVFCTTIGLGLTAWSMGIGNLYLLFASRLMTGVFASNMSVCLACVSDLSEQNEKVRNFGYLSVVAGFSFIVGAFIGGKLSDPTIDASFTPNLPLWIACVLGGINFLFIFFGFRETSKINPHVRFEFFKAFKNIKTALKTEKIKTIYAVYFLFLFAWTILFQFMPVMVVEKFSFTNSGIGDLALFMGICWALGSGYLNKLLTGYFNSLRVLEFCLLAFTLFCGLVIFPHHIYGVIGILGICVILGGLAWPLCTSLISDLAPREMQGKILGISQSMQSLAMAIAPVIGGLAYHFSSSLPFLVGAGASLVSVVLYFTLKDR